MTEVWVLMEEEPHEDYQGFEVLGVFIGEDAARKALEALRDKELTEWQARFDRDDAKNQARFNRGEISANTFNESRARSAHGRARLIASYEVAEGVDEQKRRYIGYEGQFEVRLVRFETE